jgi:hypothetical protein
MAIPGSSFNPHVNEDLHCNLFSWSQASETFDNQYDKSSSVRMGITIARYALEVFVDNPYKIGYGNSVVAWNRFQEVYQDDDRSAVYKVYSAIKYSAIASISILYSAIAVNLLATSILGLTGAVSSEVATSLAADGVLAKISHLLTSWEGLSIIKAAMKAVCVPIALFGVIAQTISKCVILSIGLGLNVVISSLLNVTKFMSKELIPGAIDKFKGIFDLQFIIKSVADSFKSYSSEILDLKQSIIKALTQ